MRLARVRPRGARARARRRLERAWSVGCEGRGAEGRQRLAARIDSREEGRNSAGGHVFLQWEVIKLIDMLGVDV